MYHFEGIQWKTRAQHKIMYLMDVFVEAKWLAALKNCKAGVFLRAISSRSQRAQASHQPWAGNRVASRITPFDWKSTCRSEDTDRSSCATSGDIRQSACRKERRNYCASAEERWVANIANILSVRQEATLQVIQARGNLADISINPCVQEDQLFNSVYIIHAINKHTHHKIGKIGTFPSPSPSPAKKRQGPFVPQKRASAVSPLTPASIGCFIAATTLTRTYASADISCSRSQL